MGGLRCVVLLPDRFRGDKGSDQEAAEREEKVDVFHGSRILKGRFKTIFCFRGYADFSVDRIFHWIRIGIRIVVHWTRMVLRITVLR